MSNHLTSVQPRLPSHTTMTAALCLDDGGHVILVHRLDPVTPWVTYFMDGAGNCHWGHYKTTLDEALESFKARTAVQLDISRRWDSFRD